MYAKDGGLSMECNDDLVALSQHKSPTRRFLGCAVAEKFLPLPSSSRGEGWGEAPLSPRRRGERERNLVRKRNTASPCPALREDERKGSIGRRARRVCAFLGVLLCLARAAFADGDRNATSTKSPGVDV